MHTLTIFFKLCELNLKKLLIYRASFFISLGLMTVWVSAYLILIEVIFYNTKTLSGWGKGEVLLIMSFYYFVQNISDIFFKDNFEEFGERVRRGELDFSMVKPAPLRLLSFFWEIRFDHAAGLAVTAGLFFYALRSLAAPLSVGMLAAGILLATVSVILYFGILNCIATLCFWVERNDTMNTIIFNISQLARYPRQIFRGMVGRVVTFGIPIALIASVPAEVALRFDNGQLPLYLVGAALASLAVSTVFWRHGLKKYTSAN